MPSLHHCGWLIEAHRDCGPCHRRKPVRFGRQQLHSLRQRRCSDRQSGREYDLYSQRNRARRQRFGNRDGDSYAASAPADCGRHGDAQLDHRGWLIEPHRDCSPCHRREPDRLRRQQLHALRERRCPDRQPDREYHLYCQRNRPRRNCVRDNGCHRHPACRHRDDCRQSRFDHGGGFRDAHPDRNPCHSREPDRFGRQQLHALRQRRYPDGQPGREYHLYRQRNRSRRNCVRDNGCHRHPARRHRDDCRQSRFDHGGGFLDAHRHRDPCHGRNPVRFGRQQLYALRQWRYPNGQPRREYHVYRQRNRSRRQQHRHPQSSP